MSLDKTCDKKLLRGTETCVFVRWGYKSAWVHVNVQYLNVLKVIFVHIRIPFNKNHTQNIDKSSLPWLVTDLWEASDCHCNVESL